MGKIEYKIIPMLLILLSFSGIKAQLNVELIGHAEEESDPRYSDVWGYVDDQGREYAIVGGFNNTLIYNLEDPASPLLVSSIPGPSSIWRDMKVHSHYAYVVTEGRGINEGLQIIDLSSLPDSAVLVKSVTDDFSSAHNIFIDEGYAYVIGTSGLGGMHILNLTDPVNPVQTAYYSESGYIHDVYVWDDTVVACAANSFDLVDVTDKNNPVLISESAELAGIYAHSGWMTEDKRYFIAAEEFNVRDLIVWDLQDRTTWNLALPSWQMESNSTIHNIFIKGNLAHISYYGDGYVVLDITDPLEPILVGHYDTDPDAVNSYVGAWGCYPYLPSGNTIIVDINNGLFILNFTPDNTTDVQDEENLIITDFKLQQNYPNPFNPSTVINYSIPEKSSVEISVFNMLGENVATLVNEVKGKGNYSASFSAEGLPSGIYIAVLKTESFAKSIKMTLLK